MKRILIVDDEDRPKRKYRIALEVAFPGAVEVITASTLYDAQCQFQDNKTDLILVVMDACLEGGTPDTLQLVQEIKNSKEFTGKIIANSGSPEYQQQLIDAGCHNTSPGKVRLETDIVEIVRPLLR